MHMQAWIDYNNEKERSSANALSISNADVHDHHHQSLEPNFIQKAFGASGEPIRPDLDQEHQACLLRQNL
jgi:hypothetical protein